MINMLKIMFLCRWVRARLLLYFCGETDAADTHVIKDHLGKCSHCNKYSRKLSNINILVAECMRKDKNVPPTLTKNVMEQVRAEQTAE